MADKPNDSADKAYAAASAAAAPKAEPAKPVAATQIKKAAPEVPALPPTPKPTLTELKEKIMASAKTPDFSKTITDAFGEMQTRAKTAYEKSTEMAGEATEFAKGNVEALVESSKILAAGLQDIGKTCADEAKDAYETISADMKDMAAVKSPTELFQLQGKLMRRNFDAMVAYGSKSSEAMMKLANDSFAPLTGRMSVAAEKIAKVA